MPEFLPQFFVKINGQNVSQEFMTDVQEIVVDSTLYLPEMATIVLQDPDLKWVDDSGLLDLGKSLEISAQSSEEFGGEQGLLFKGEITALEPSFSADGKTTMLIRGYSKSHRLHRGKQVKTFLKQKDSDIASSIAGEVGLSPTVDATSVTYDYILQNNQTNMEFLQGRAERIGYQAFAQDGKLYFKKGEANLGDGPTLKFGDNLRTFQPALSSTHQADKVVVKGWDPAQKKSIKGQATPNSAMNQGGIGKTGGAAAKSAFGAAEAVIVTRPVVSQAEADALATGLANDLCGEFIEAEGMCDGHPQVKAGWRITIDGVGTRFGGKYFVTAATHIWNANGYETRFSISGRRPNTLSHLLSPTSGVDTACGLMKGVVIAQVTNLNDPDNWGRVKVKYPWLDDAVESDWIRIAAIGAGAERGMFYLPEINDEVLVAFEHGDPHYPFIVGGLWNGKDKPPLPNNEASSGGKVNQRIIKSRSGHVIILDDTDNSEKIIIQDKTGKNEIVIDTAKNTMDINLEKDINLTGKGNITLTATGNIELKATGDVKIDGANVKVTGKQKGDVTAPQVAINGSMKVDVKGGMINLN